VIETILATRERPSPADATIQCARREFVSACGFVNAKGAGYEADDFLAAAVATEERRGGTVLVASGDRDTFQLASDRTTILYPVRAGEMARIGPAEVRARYGVDPQQVPDFIALRGDPSDKLPGAPGVGAVGLPRADLARLCPVRKPSGRESCWLD
jgi:5'-3' exonuclease